MKNGHDDYSTIGRYVNHLGLKKYSDSTIKHYGATAVEFVEYLQKNNFSLRKIGNTTLEDYQKYLSQQNLSSSSINTKLHGVASLLDFIGENNSRKIFKFNKTKTKRPALVTEQDIGLIIDIITKKESEPSVAARNRMIFALFYYTGIKISEIISLKKSDFRDDAMFIVNKLVKLHPKASEMVRLYLKTRKDTNDYLIISHIPGRLNDSKISTRSIENMVNKYRQLAGLYFSINDLRNSFVINNKNAAYNHAFTEIKSHSEIFFDDEFLKIPTQ